MRSGRNLVAALGAALWLGAPGAALADPQEGELADVTFNADTGTINGSIDVAGATSGTFQYKVRKVDVRNGELTLSGSLTATFGRSSQQLGTVAMRLSDGEGVCDMMALTSSTMHLKHLGIAVDSQAVDLAISASSTSGRVTANLLCSATHLLDEPGPLTSQVAAINAIVNRSLGAPSAQPAARPRLTNESITPSPNIIERSRPRSSRSQVTITYPSARDGEVGRELKPARGRQLPQLPTVDEDELLEP